MQISDFRSDTVTRPTPAMRAAMNAAPVGDDVFGEDPTVNELEEYAAEILGHESAVFVPSGTMSNQIALRVHCRPGDEVLCDANCHIVYYEQGGAAQLSGITLRGIAGRDGALAQSDLADKIQPDDVHCVRTRLVSLENTLNRGAGRILPYDRVCEISSWARSKGLSMHLDGARLLNAVVATRMPAAVWGKQFDTVNLCFSKGLGAPVGSVLAGSRDRIRDARRHRKVLGGGMRQAGFLAAAAIYALENHVERLAEDHLLARMLADRIQAIKGLTVRPTVETNIVMFDVDPSLGPAPAIAAQLAKRGVLTLSLDPTRIRAVTHLDVNEADVERMAIALSEIVSEATPL